MRKIRLIDYQEELIKALKDPEEAREYLKAALDDDDPRVFLLALKDVASARGLTIAALADKTQLNRASLYRMFSGRGSAHIIVVIKILNALGLCLTIVDQRGPQKTRIGTVRKQK